MLLKRRVIKITNHDLNNQFMEKKYMDKINVAVSGSLDTDTGQKTPALMQQLDSINGINLNAYY